MSYASGAQAYFQYGQPPPLQHQPPPPPLLEQQHVPANDGYAYRNDTSYRAQDAATAAMTYSGDFSSKQASQPGYQQQQQHYDNRPPSHTHYPPSVAHGTQLPPQQQYQQYPAPPPPPPPQGGYTAYAGDSQYQAYLQEHVTPPAQYPASVASGAYSASAGIPPPLHQAATVPAMLPPHTQQQYVSPPPAGYHHQHHVSAPQQQLPATYANPEPAYHHHYSSPPASVPLSASGTCPYHQHQQQQQQQQQNQYPQGQVAAYPPPPAQQDSYYPPQQQQQQPPPAMRQSLSQDGYPPQGSENYRLDGGLSDTQSYKQQQQQQPQMYRQHSAGYPSAVPEYHQATPASSLGPPVSGRQYSNPGNPPQSGPSPLGQPPSAPVYGTQQHPYPPKQQSPLGQQYQSPPPNHSLTNNYHPPSPQAQPLSQAQMQRHQSLRVTTAHTTDPMLSVSPGSMLRPVVSARADTRNSYTEHRQSFGAPPQPSISTILSSEPVIAQAPGGVGRRESSSGYNSNIYGSQQGTVSSLVNSMGALSVGSGGPPYPPRPAVSGPFASPPALAASSLTIPSQLQASQATLSPKSGAQQLLPPVRSSTYSNNLSGLGSQSTLVGSTAPGVGRSNSTQLAAVQSSIPASSSQQRATPTFAQTGENMAYPVWNNISATAFQAFRHQIPVQQSNLSGTKYALIVGCNYYGKEYSQTSNINGAHTLKTLLVSRYGYKEKNVVLLSDDQKDPRNHPTYQLISTHIKRMMRDVRPNDSVFFYFCGFGRLPMQLAEEHTETLSSIRKLREDFVLPCDFENHGAISSSYLHKHLVGHLPRSARLTVLFNCIVNDTGLGIPYKYIHTNGRAVLTSAIAGNNLFEAGMKLGHAPSINGSFGDLTQRFETSLIQQQAAGGKADRETDEMDRIRQSSGDIVVFGWDRNYADPRYKRYMAHTPSNMLCSYWAAAMEDTQRTKGRVTFGDLLGSLQSKTKDIVMMPFVASGRKISMDEEFSI